MTTCLPHSLRAALVAAVLTGLVPAAASEPTPVTVKRFSQVRLYPEYSAPATVISLNDSEVSAEVSGVIESIAVRPGDQVAADAELVRLDCRDHELAARVPRARLEAARAERELADFRYQRGQKLEDRGAMPLEQFQQRKAAALKARAEVQRLQARVAESRRAVDKCVVRAPFPAVVVGRFASVGEMASPGTRLLRLVDTELLEVSSQIQEQDLASVREAERIRLVSQGERYPLRLRSVVPVLDSRVSSYEVRFRFPGDAPTPGQSGRLNWRDDRAHVPANLVVERDGRQGVFIVAGDEARFRALEHAKPGQPAPAGLAPGTRLVVDGRYGLSDGQAVRTSDR